MALKITRCPENPIVWPGRYEWRMCNVYNPGALHDEGRFYLYERASGSLRPHCCAIGLLESESVDLVLLDLHLPPDPDSPRQGLAVEQCVRALPREVPVVVVSANEDPELRTALLARGVRAFLRKPVDPECLRALILELLAP